MAALDSKLPVDPRHLEFRFVRAAGPGGQNVNKVSTAVELRFDVRGSSLPPAVKSRLLKHIGLRGSKAGVLVIRARTFRTQLANRNAAIRRLTAMLQEAAAAPKPRASTRPTQPSMEERLRQKKQRSNLKRSRKSASADE